MSTLQIKPPPKNFQPLSNIQLISMNRTEFNHNYNLIKDLQKEAKNIQQILTPKQQNYNQRLKNNLIPKFELAESEVLEVRIRLDYALRQITLLTSKNIKLQQEFKELCKQPQKV